MEAPKRKHELTLVVSGDTHEDVIACLNHFVSEFELRGLRAFATGGITSGGHSELVSRPNQTPDKFQEDLRIYMEHKKNG